MVLDAPSRHHWVIGDVHGCFRSLETLLAVLPVHDHLIFLGDLINRGDGIEATMNLVWDLVLAGRATWLRGNHEQDLIDALQAGVGADPDQLQRIDTYRLLGERLAREWLPRLERLPFVYEADGWSATHAGFNREGQPDLSIRNAFWDSYDGRFGRVVIGHTPRLDVERSDRLVMVDTGAIYGGWLTAFCPETDALVQVQGARLTSPAPQPNRQRPPLALLSGESSAC